MTMLEAILARHSVRAYREQPIDAEIVDRLRAEIAQCNKEGGLHLQLITGEPDAFGGFMAHYGKFTGVHNYIALVGKRSRDLDERLIFVYRHAQTSNSVNECFSCLQF